MESKPGKELFKCSLCMKKFKSELSLAIHNKMYGQNDVYRSAHDKLSRSRSRSKFWKVFRQHAKDKIHKCQICMKSFDSRSNLIRHAVLFSHSQPSHDDRDDIMASSVKGMEKVDPKKDEPSVARLYRSSDDSSFEDVARHVRVGSSEQPYECKICGKSFRFKCDVIRHVRGHTGDKPYFCSFCDKTFNYGGNLNKHVLRRHKDKKVSGLLTRRKANKGRKRKFNFSHNRHIQRKRKSFKDFKTLTKEKSDEKVCKTDLSPKCFECGMCSKICEDKMEIMKHIEVHVKKRSHTCPFCQKEFKSAYICEKHKRKNHLDEDSSVRRSPRMSKGGNRKKFQDFVLFDEDSDLENNVSKLKDSVKGKEKIFCYIIHSETTSGKKVFECSACSKQFSSLRFIKRHIQSHTGENVHSTSGKSSSDEDGRPSDMSDLEEFTSGSDGDWELGDQRKKGLKSVKTEYNFFPQGRHGRLGKGSLQNKQRMLKRSNIRKVINANMGYGKDVIENEGNSSNNAADQFEEASSDEAFTRTPNGYSCKECGQLFNFVSNFYKHMQRIHGDRPAPRQRQHVKSSICNKTIILESIAIAKGEKLFRCSECGYESNSSGNLYKHMRRVHRGCTIEKKDLYPSGKRASQKMQVVKCAAWETKAGERVFECSACGYRSNFSSNIYKHLRRKHKDCIIEGERKSPVKNSKSNQIDNGDVEEGNECKKKLFSESPPAPPLLPRETHKIFVNNKSVSVLMNQDSIMKRKAVENPQMFDEVGAKKKKVETSLWSLEDTIVRNKLPEESESASAVMETVQSSLQTVQTVPIFVNQEDTLRMEEAETNAVANITHQDGVGETMTLVIKPEDDATFNQSSVYTILINAEDIVEGDVNANSGQAVTILLNPEDSLEQKAAESLLDLAIKEDPSNLINVLKGSE